MKTLMRFLKDEAGVAAIEYAIIASLISVAAVSGIKVLGTQLNNSFTNVGTNL